MIFMDEIEKTFNKNLEDTYVRFLDELENRTLNFQEQELLREFVCYLNKNM